VSARAAAGGGWPRELARAVAAPVACAAVVVGLLSAWVAAGGAGTVTVSRAQIQVTLAAVPMASQDPGPASAPQPDADFYLTIRNLAGGPDALTAVSSSVAKAVILTRGRGAAPVPFTGGVAIQAHGTLTLSPSSGYDAVMIGGPLLLAGQQVPLALAFRSAGTIRIEATVTIPGTNPGAVIGEG
jgi:copper(I)-binding protein